MITSSVLEFHPGVTDKSCKPSETFGKVCCCSDPERQKSLPCAGPWLMSSDQHYSGLKGTRLSLDLPKPQQAQYLLHPWLRAPQLPQRTNLASVRHPVHKKCWKRKSAYLVRDKRRVSKRQGRARAGPSDRSGQRDIAFCLASCSVHKPGGNCLGN